MTKTVKDYMTAAKKDVPAISVPDAQKMLANDNALLLDVRDSDEVAKSGKARGALNISRGMIEFRADENMPMYNPELKKDRPLILYCASGGRAALAAKVLQDMGYSQVFVLGSLKDWIDAGGAVEGGVI